MSLIYWVIGFLIAFGIPAIVKLIFPHHVTFKEFFASCGISILCVIAFYAFLKIGATHDTEIWNGEVVKKYSDKVSCEHSYSCNCTTVCSGTGSNRTCQQVCQTCYEHSYDVDWVVKANVGGTTISRVDRQGLKTPPRWAAVKIGEPYSETYSFTNYIKAAPDSLFAGSKALIQQYEGKFPNYPSIHDYYKVNRVISLGVSIDKTLNEKLNELHKKWGPQKQINVIPVFVNEKYSQEFFKALEAKWLGGKKNDAVIVTQIDKNGNVSWTRVMSRDEHKVFDKSIEFDMAQMGTFDTDKFVKILDDNVMNKFQRENFHKYEYLLNEFTPSGIAVTLGLILSLIINIVVGYFAVKEDWFGGYYGRFSR